MVNGKLKEKLDEHIRGKFVVMTNGNHKECSGLSYSTSITLCRLLALSDVYVELWWYLTDGGDERHLLAYWN